MSDEGAIATLRGRLAEAEETLRAIRAGEVDAVVVEGADGPRPYTLRSADQPYRILVEQMAEGALMLKRDGGILYANRRFADLLGLGLDQLDGSLEHYLDAEDFRRLQATMEGGSGQQEAALRAGDAGAVPVLISVRPMVAADDIHGFSVIVTDLREQKRLARSERDLAASAAAHAAKNRFLSVLSHEIRNPLGSMRTALEVLASRPSAATDQRMRAILARQVSHLGALVDDLIDFARIERGKLHVDLARVDVAPWLGEVVDARRPEAERRGVVLECLTGPGPVPVEVDATRLKQVIDNLLSNALRATDRGGTVRVALAADPVARLARLSVRDDGRGIAPADLDRIFEPFTQAEDPSRRHSGGLGLGLSLARGLVERQGGRLTATSEGAGAGAEFRIELPLQEPAAAQPPPPAGRLRSTSLRVLVIDDNRDFADALALLLEQEGHESRVAYTGSDGLRMVRASAPDVVLSDLGLPGLSGLELAARLRRECRFDGFLVALTGFADEEAVRDSNAAGFDAHLTKPVDLGVLRAILHGRRSCPDPGT